MRPTRGFRVGEFHGTQAVGDHADSEPLEQIRAGLEGVALPGGAGDEQLNGAVRRAPDLQDGRRRSFNLFCPLPNPLRRPRRRHGQHGGGAGERTGRVANHDGIAAGLRRLHEGKVLALLPSTGNGDAPGPEYALLEGQGEKRTVQLHAGSAR